MFFYSNPVNACLPSASVDGHFLFPYFENCVVTTLFRVVIRKQMWWQCGDISSKRIKIKIANSLIIQLLAIFLVVPPGIEPGTQGFSVLCSTNWAMAPFVYCNRCLFPDCECKDRTFFFTVQIFSRKSLKNFSLCHFCYTFASSKVDGM